MFMTIYDPLRCITFYSRVVIGSMVSASACFSRGQLDMETPCKYIKFNYRLLIVINVLLMTNIITFYERSSGQQIGLSWALSTCQQRLIALLPHSVPVPVPVPLPLPSLALALRLACI